MDSIDITDTAFSLSVPELNEYVRTDDISITDNATFIYIGLALLGVLLIAVVSYKYHQTKKYDAQDSREIDCTGGFCTMENRNSSHI